MQEQESQADVLVVQTAERQATFLPLHLVARERQRSSALVAGEFDPLRFVLTTGRFKREQQFTRQSR